jgi:hypothetical protein
MRALAPSFRDELRIYYDQLKNLKQKPDWRDKLAFGLIDRWLKRDDAEQIWRDLKSALPASFEITPAQFVYQVAQRRIQAKRAAEIVREGPRLVQDVKKRLKHDLAKSKIEAVHDISGELKRFQVHRARDLGRQQGADRTWFMWSWSETFRMVCGRPLDELVAALTEIAFDLKDIGVDHVRTALRTMSKLRKK